MLQIHGTHNTANVYADVIDQQTIDQLRTIVNHQVSDGSHIAVMGDCHSGKGAVIGYTQTLVDRVCPNILGVDIACSVSVTNIGKLDSVDFNELDRVIRTYVRSGMNIQDHCVCDQDEIDDIINSLCIDVDDYHREYYRRSVGSIGGGNHFIELNRGSNGNYFLVVHCGSRHLGVDVHDHYIKIAQTDNTYDADYRAMIDNLKAQRRFTEIESAIAQFKSTRSKMMNDPLAYLVAGTDEYYQYLNDVRCCNAFARLNHETVVQLITEHMNWNINDQFTCVHNTIGSDKIIRKGATDARRGLNVVVPINMAFGSVIGVGLGNESMNCSAPHGAGRIMSRTAAKKSITLDQYIEAMNGVYTTSATIDTIDEAPFVYKKFEDIESCLNNTIQITDIIKPVYNFKAGGD